MGTRLIIEGNAVYEIDEDCQRTSRKGVEELNDQERSFKGKRGEKKDSEQR